jgi:fumarate reductase subunit C
MQYTSRLLEGVGLAGERRKSRWPARMDWLQSASGLALGLFMWGHMLFVSSILVSEDFMWSVTKAFEGYFFFGRGYPIVVSVIVLVVIALLLVHAFLAMRKFPETYQQYRTFIGHKNLLRHEDTTLWWIQVLTGFALFFLAAVHLHQMLMHPADIGPYESADRVWTGRWLPFYVITLFAVELHGGIGMYRLAVKWGWFEGRDAAASRARLRRAKWILTAFLIVLGLTTLAAYARIGYAHRDDAGGRYVPTWQRSPGGQR